MSMAQPVGAAQPAPQTGGDGEPEPRPHRRWWTVDRYAGQVVTAQTASACLVAGVAGLASGTTAGALWSGAALPVGLLLLVLAVGRWRYRWLYEWVRPGVRYLVRRRTLPAGADPTALLALLRPGATAMTIDVDGTPVGAVADANGLTAVFELGDPSGVLPEADMAVPALASLLPPAAPDQPVIRLQLLLSGVVAMPVGTGGAAAASYRQLTEGRILAQRRALLAVHVGRGGRFAAEDLRRALASAVRRAGRRMDRQGLPSRPLAADSILRVLTELAQYDHSANVVERWSNLEVGALRQVSFRIIGWEGSADAARALVPRLLTLPSAGTTISLASERASDADQLRVELVVRLAAADPTALRHAVDALGLLLAAVPAQAHRLDGAHLPGLAATLPLGGGADGSSAALSGLVVGHDGLDTPGRPAVRLDAGAATSGDVPVGAAGLVLGMNRHGEAVTVRLFRAEPTRVVLIGTVACAQMVILRALALGARVTVATGRPQAWEPFLRGASGPVDAVTLLPSERPVEPPPATAVRPQLVVLDAGPAPDRGRPSTAGGPPAEEHGGAWRCTLLLRDDLSEPDVDVLARADATLLQPLTAAEALLAASALGLGDTAEWLTRIRGDMVGLVVGRRTVRWALLSATPIERQLIGDVSRRTPSGV